LLLKYIRSLLTYKISIVMKKRIVLNAALIWKELMDAEAFSIHKLRSLTKLSEMEFEAALDWLIHEKKVSIEGFEGERQIAKADAELMYYY
ncbi:MAG: winged helix-turn-helix domain-containing protein, partial [Bacteroidales bacterium]